MRHDIVEDIMRYESGEMDDDDMTAFFQSLVDSGLAWQLQGHYGRVAQALLDAGVIHEPNSDDFNVEAENE